MLCPAGPSPDPQHQLGFGSAHPGGVAVLTVTYRSPKKSWIWNWGQRDEARSLPQHFQALLLLPASGCAPRPARPAGTSPGCSWWVWGTRGQRRARRGSRDPALPGPAEPLGQCSPPAFLTPDRGAWPSCAVGGRGRAGMPPVLLVGLRLLQNLGIFRSQQIPSQGLSPKAAGRV